MRKPRTRLLRLPDGRALEYLECGDPHGAPVLYFHGFLGSCYQAALLHERALQDGMRIIAPSRPGIGRSSCQGFDSMTAYAKGDIRWLMDHLGIQSFAVLGASGGGGFALATAYAMPDRVCVAGIAGALGPLASGRNVRALCWWRRAIVMACNGWPRAAAALLRMFLTVCWLSPRTLKWYLRWTTEINAPAPHLQKLLQRVLWWDFQSVFLQPNGIPGLVDEVGLYFRWGFQPHRFPGNVPVIAWHGRDDLVVPWSAARRMLRALRTKSRFLLPGGHLAFLPHQQRIFAVIKRELMPWARF